MRRVLQRRMGKHISKHGFLSTLLRTIKVGRMRNISHNDEHTTLTSHNKRAEQRKKYDYRLFSDTNSNNY